MTYLGASWLAAVRCEASAEAVGPNKRMHLTGRFAAAGDTRR
jgi:hypothetical protein